MESLLGNTRKKDLTFHADGRIDISARVTQMLRLERGDVVDIALCGREPYLYVRHRAPLVGRHEASCFPTKRGSRNFRAFSKKLCRAMMELSGAGGERLELGVGEPDSADGMGVVLPVIYRNILNRDHDKGNQVQRILGQPVRL